MAQRQNRICDTMIEIVDTSGVGWVMRQHGVLFSVVASLLIISTVYGQVANCPALVQQALAATAANCADVSRNTACYGYNQVEATFAQTQSVGFFSKPADRANLLQLQTVRTVGADVTVPQWGIAVMNVQANVPNTIPGQGVIVMLLGDAQVQNAVAPDQALTSTFSLNVVVQSRTNPHAAPSLDSPNLGTVEANSILAADALSADSQWVRIAYQGQPAWISRGVLNPNDPISSLPVITDDTHTPMQAFYFSTGVGTPTCAEAPSIVGVKSPENIKIDLTVNGAAIRVGSLVGFRSLPNNGISLTVFEGGVETQDGRVVQTGETLTASLDKQGNIINWQTPRPATAGELQPDAVLQNVVKAATGTSEVIQTTPEPGDCQGPITHVVEKGENIFRIALRYDTSISSIVAASHLSNPRLIHVGDVLTIPNPCSGFVNDAPADTNPPPQQPPANTTLGVDCSTLRPTSPIGRMPYGNLTFYWDGAAGATHYAITIVDGNGNFRRTYTTTDNQTHIDTQTTDASIGGGNQFAWSVTAFQGDSAVCTSGRVSAVRDAAPPPPPPKVCPASTPC